MKHMEGYIYPCCLSPTNGDPGSTQILTEHHGAKSQTISQLHTKCQQAFLAPSLGQSQYLLSVYRLHGIILTSIISLTDLSATLCLFMVFTGSCMIGFNLQTNYHSDPESLIRKSRSRLSSSGSSGSHVQENVNKFQGSPPPHKPSMMAAQMCIN
jgi:hypothetical protein